MPRSIDDTFDWGGFDLGLKNKDESDAKKLIDKESLAYAEQTHDYDTYGAVGDWLGKAGGLATGGGAAALAASGPVGGALMGLGALSGIIGGIFSSVAANKKKEETQAEAEKEQADAEELEKKRASAPSMQNYGSAMRNSGV
jgi:hypothetical protein